MSSSETIDRAAFIKWLELHPKDQSFNMNNGCKCMLATFMTVATGDKTTMAGTNMYERWGYRGYTSHYCPAWATRFQETAIDRDRFIGGYTPGTKFPMTVGEALALLKQQGE